jgi:hypothetical protein
MSSLLVRVLEMPTECLGQQQNLGHAQAKVSEVPPSKGGLSGPVGPVSSSQAGALPSECPETVEGLILDGHAVKEVLENNGQTAWFKDTEGKVHRYFASQDKSFPVQIVKPGDPAICANCGESYRWLPFPAFANICRDCQPPSIGWIPDPGTPRFEGDLELRTGPACRSCGERERWREAGKGPWICRICHPSAR